MQEDESSAEWQTRPGSAISQTVLAGTRVYIKRQTGGQWGADAAILRARAAREADVIQRVERSGLFESGLGTLHLVSADPEQTQIVTEEVAGKPLDEWLAGPYRRSLTRESLRSLFLAGRWLRQFQALANDPSDEGNFSSNDSDDLTEYCRVRLRTIGECGYSWPDAAARRQLEQRISDLLAQATFDDQRHVWGHGDYQPGNVLWDGRKLTVLDFGMASLRMPLSDVTAFLHRLEMLRMYFPWKRWPVECWQHVFLWGYGRPLATRSPMFQAFMIRHWLCRLQSLVRRPARTLKDQVHNAWIRRCVRHRLASAIAH